MASTDVNALLVVRSNTEKREVYAMDHAIEAAFFSKLDLMQTTVADHAKRPQSAIPAARPGSHAAFKVSGPQQASVPAYAKTLPLPAPAQSIEEKRSRLSNLTNTGRWVLHQAATTGVRLISKALSESNQEPSFKVLGFRQISRPKPVHVYLAVRQEEQAKKDKALVNVASKYLSQATVTGNWLLTQAYHPRTAFHDLKHFLAERRANHSIQRAVGASFPATISNDADLKQTKDAFLKLAHYIKDFGAEIHEKRQLLDNGPAQLFDASKGAKPCSCLMKAWVGKWAEYADGLERLRLAKKMLDQALQRIEEYKDKNEYRHRCELHGGYPCAFGRSWRTGKAY